MSLKRIEIEGFKSFPNRTVIDFENGFTCIVGPNGCGKSNISDAIRWVLGEKSPKQVRGSNMKDVIFSGAEQKKEMGYAEVTLYFDNSDRRFKYSGDEFSITRKIFRSRPDNFYYINGKQKKLAEIIELFRDTGAGKDGFSIVGQGKISDIINFKDVDRRRIFDEAAGVAHVKQDKRKALDKLKSVSIDMQSKQEGLDYLNKDLNSLQIQVEKAKAAKTLDEELKSERLNYFVHIYEQSEKSKERFRKKIAEDEEYIANKELTIAQLNKKIASYDEETDLINTDIGRKYELQRTLSVEQANRSGALKLHNKNIETKQDTLEKCKKEVAVTEKNITELEEKIKNNSAILDEDRTQKADLDLKQVKLNAKIEAYTGEYEQAEQRLQTLNDSRLLGADQLGVYLSSKASAESQANLLTETIKSLEDEIEEKQENVKEVQKAIATAENTYKFRNEIYMKAVEKKRELGARSNDTINNRSTKASQVETLNAAYNEALAEYTRYKYAIESERGYNRVTTSILEKAKVDPSFGKCIIGPVGEMYTVDVEYEEAISAALVGSKNHLITRNTQDTEVILNYARSLHQGRAVCQPISEVTPEELSYDYYKYLKDPAVIGVAADLIKYNDECSNIYRRLLGRFVVVKDYDNAVRIWRQSKRGFKIVTLQGEYFDVSGSISAGDNKSDNYPKYIAAKDTLKRITEQLKTATQEYEDLKKKEIQLRSGYQTIMDEVDEKRNAAVEANNQVKALKDNLANIEKDILAITAKKATAESRLEAAQKELDSAKNKQNEASENRLSVDDLINEAQKNKEALKATLDATVEEKHNLDIEVENLKSKIANLETLIDDLTKDRKTKFDIAQSLKNDAANLEEEIKSLIESTPKVEYSEDVKNRLDAIAVEIQNAEKRREEIKELRLQADKEKNDCTDKITIATSSKASAQTSIENVDSELEEWRESIFTDYNLDYESALPYRKEEFEKNKTKNNIARIKAARTKLGEINENAEQSYNEKKEEFDKISKIMSDLVAAKQDVEGLIVRYSKEIDDKFNAAFDTINSNFQTTFTDLFGGGKAELYLTENENDDQDKGVDIDVTLPGKSRKPLSLLSGGEQTLTAIAILFAILKYKGSPFVVLDEVESALDEVNCIKFAKYLKQFAQFTRFIVITHKKPTMSEGDVLYGVTMMAPGVSNILTVTMAEAMKLAEKEDK